MAAKVKQELLKNYQLHCDEAVEKGILECMKAPIPFMTTLSLLSSSDCLLVLSNFPLTKYSKETDTINVTLLYGLTDAVVHCFLHHEYPMFANRSCRVSAFWKICRYLEKHWTNVFTKYTTQDFSDAAMIFLKSLLKLLRDCSNRLQGTDESNIFYNVLKFADESFNTFISKSDKNQTASLKKTSCPKKGCTCVMCFIPSPPQKETPVKVGSIKVRSLSDLLTASEEKKLENKCNATKILPLPFTQMKMTKVASRIVTDKSSCENKLVSPAPPPSEPIIISDSPIKVRHNNICKFTEKKSPLKSSTQINDNSSSGSQPIKKNALDFKPVSAKRPLFSDSVSNPEWQKKICLAKRPLLPVAVSKPVSQMKIGPAKRPLIPDASPECQKKKCPENAVLSDGKINAFAFLMRGAKRKNVK